MFDSACSLAGRRSFRQSSLIRKVKLAAIVGATLTAQCPASDVSAAGLDQLLERWFVMLYPDRPLEYNQLTGQWFVPFELMVGRRLSQRLRLGLGWATKVAGSDTRYRSLFEALVEWTF